MYRLSSSPSPAPAASATYDFDLAATSSSCHSMHDPFGFNNAAAGGQLMHAPYDSGCMLRRMEMQEEDIGLNLGHRVDEESVAARKVQRSDREKLRRDRLNEQFEMSFWFLELGNELDPDRPKNDKAAILSDTVQILKDLTAQVSQLKAEYNLLSEECRELTREKNELREEKANLKSEINDLNNQYEQMLGVFLPWATVDPSLVMHRPGYPFPMSVPIPSAPIPIHPVQTYPFFCNPSHGTTSNPCSTCMPYSSLCNPQVEQSSSQHINQNLHTKTTRSQTSSHQDSRSKPSDHYQQNSGERNDGFSDVAAELELETPGSAVRSQSKSPHDQDLSSEIRKGKRRPPHKGSGVPTSSSSSRCSSCSVPDDNSSGVGDGSVSEK